MKIYVWISTLCVALFVCNVTTQAQPIQQKGIWSLDKAQKWYAQQPWLVGCNYIPSNAVNQLEMWQAETFDSTLIDKELSLARRLGMNTLRVFLHDLPWEQDSIGFKQRIDQFLIIANKNKIKPVFVLFDSRWDPNPKPGKQALAQPGVHNSRWVQSPGAESLKKPAQYARLEVYVKGLIGHFRNDNRILGWDIWNEPDNTNKFSYSKQEPINKVKLIIQLLPQVFLWARSAQPSQPITSGIWAADWASREKLTLVEKIQIEYSDIISFHNYSIAQDFEKQVKLLEAYKRPLFCTEFMARGNGNSLKSILPIAKKYKVAAYCWGLVAGKTQTNLPLDSWQLAYEEREPNVWFQEIFWGDGTPYKAEEVAFLRLITKEKR